MTIITAGPKGFFENYSISFMYVLVHACNYNFFNICIIRETQERENKMLIFVSHKKRDSTINTVNNNLWIDRDRAVTTLAIISCRDVEMMSEKTESIIDEKKAREEYYCLLLH